ncbi:hypothetical protein ACQ4PT_001006 [Festuca glaucescens]
MKTTTPLLTPYKMGQFDLLHRVVLAPLTRQRAYGGVPQPHAAVYYAQRGSPGGFLISEGTRIAAGSPAAAARQEQESSSSFKDVPGIWAQEHVEAWRPVVDAVHAKGAVFFCQLWHVADDVVRQRQQQVSPQMSFDGRREELSSLRRVAAEDASGVVDWFRRAARNAIDAGFDGVEILGANGYFVDDEGQGANGLERRSRFALEVVEAVVREVGGHRVGVRLDQFAATPDEHALALHVVSWLSDRGVLYCHMIEPRVDERRRVSRRLLSFREAFGGTFMPAAGTGGRRATQRPGCGTPTWWHTGGSSWRTRTCRGEPLNECDHYSSQRQQDQSKTIY